MDMTIARAAFIPDAQDLAVLTEVAAGLPLVANPYAVIAARLGMREGEVLARLWRLREGGLIKRFGVVVRHHELGYRANAMVVWDLPDDEVAAIGAALGRLPFVTLCYRRPRRLPDWRYNLFTMIHGRDRAQVLARVDDMAHRSGLNAVPHAVLFSQRRFKQRGARYAPDPASGDALGQAVAEACR